MPDEHGNLKGITVPRVPWHEEEDEDLIASLDQADRALRDGETGSLEDLKRELDS